jgi:hypothetical protein
MKDDLVKQIPALGSKYETFKSYSGQTIHDMFPKEIVQRSVVKQAHMLESVVLINEHSGTFQVQVLPVESQLSPVFAIALGDFDNDGVRDILLGGNLSRAKPETGIYCAGHGLLLKGRGQGEWAALPTDSSGFFTQGEIRDFESIKINGKQVICVARNNENLHFYTF